MQLTQSQNGYFIENTGISEYILAMQKVFKTFTLLLTFKKVDKLSKILVQRMSNIKTCSVVEGIKTRNREEKNKRMREHM